MRIKLQINQIAELMKALRRGGEDPNDYFEVVLGDKPSLEEGQTRLTEFNKTITDKQEPRKGRKTKAKKTKAKKTKAKKTKAKKVKKIGGKWALVSEERLANLPNGIATFWEIVNTSEATEEYKAANIVAQRLTQVSTVGEDWINPKTGNPDGRKVNSMKKYLKHQAKETVIPKETKIAPSSEAWIEAEVQWLGQHYEHNRQHNLSNKMIAIDMAKNLGTKQRKAWEIRDMAKNLGLN